MKNHKDKLQKIPPWEKPLFIMIITFVGGYMNGYTYITRNNILANMHTANMSKFGINIALGKWLDALTFFIPIISCILGAAFSELIKTIIVNINLKGDWRKYALILESIALFSVGLFPTSFPDVIVTNLVSFLMGYQLCLFRTCLGVPFNTTICTGNIRNVGQLFFTALDEENKNTFKKLITFTALTFSFAIGAIPGTLISMAISIKAVWICSIILLFQAFWIYSYELTNINALR